LLNWLHGLIGNWGWSIVLLTIIVKTLLLPLTNASYRSMAKMRAVAPKLEMLKKQHGDDRAALQQAMMKMYKDEKINPLGGCLPMLLQFPVFIGFFRLRFAATVFSRSPPIGSTFPVRESSPVIARCGFIRFPVKSDTKATAIVIPALGPSFGVAPSGI